MIADKIEVLDGKGILLTGPSEEEPSNPRKRRKFVVSQLKFSFNNAPANTPLTLKVKAGAISAGNGFFPHMSIALFASQGGEESEWFC